MKDWIFYQKSQTQKKVVHNPGAECATPSNWRHFFFAQAKGHFCCPDQRAHGPWARAHGLLWCITILLRLYSILLYYFIYYFIYFIYHFIYFLKALKRLCVYREYKIAFLTPSKIFKAYFVDFDIFHRFSPKTYFWGWTAAATAVATAAEEFPQTSSPHSHHAQG